ncbi:hypothetical protein CR513_38910, partial [Mucuna pruriens]
MRMLLFGTKLALSICSIRRDKFLPNLKTWEKIDTCNTSCKKIDMSMNQYYPKRNCIGSKNLDVNDNLKITFIRRKYGLFKVLGPDRLHLIFFQENWPMPNRIQEINSILLVLIPKCDALSFLHQFHPISLCNVIYKNITNIIVTKLKQVMPMLVGLNPCIRRHVIDIV